MSRGKLLFALGMAGVVALVWLLVPIYGFFAHRGELPLPAFGWENFPEGDAPVTQQVFDPAYAEAGARTIEAMERRRAEAGLPSYSAAALVGGEIVWQGAVGWADLKTQRPATPATVYRVGSTSKAITATALARMVDRGDIDLDAPISTYLGALPNDAWASITPRMLASHMAGMPHYKDNTELVGLYQSMALQTEYPTVQSAVQLFDESELLFEPGTDFEYSSLGTVLLGQVMSEAGGKPYRQIIQDEVLDPAGAVSTHVSRRAPKPGGATASLYYKDGERFRPWRPVDLSHRLPGGGYAATPTDLARIGGLTLRNGYVSAETRAEFWTPQELATGEVNEQDYAIGWRWREWDIAPVGVVRNANHGGVSRGSQCWLIVMPDYDMSLAFCTNTKTAEFRDFGMLYEDIVSAFAGASEGGDGGPTVSR